MKPCAPSILRRRWTTPPRWWGLAGMTCWCRREARTSLMTSCLPNSPSPRATSTSSRLIQKPCYAEPRHHHQADRLRLHPPSQEKNGQGNRRLGKPSNGQVEGSPAKPGFDELLYCWRHLKADRQTVRCKMALSGGIRGCGPR